MNGGAVKNSFSTYVCAKRFYSCGDNSIKCMCCTLDSLMFLCLLVSGLLHDKSLTFKNDLQKKKANDLEKKIGKLLQKFN